MSLPQLPPGVPVNEAILHVDQQITLCLQRIDAHFAQAHETIQGGILPKVRRYGEQCLQIGDASKFWRMFFETAAQVRLTQPEDEFEAQGESSQTALEVHNSGEPVDPQGDLSKLDSSHNPIHTTERHHAESFDESLLLSPPGIAHHSPPRPSLGALKGEAQDSSATPPKAHLKPDLSDESMLVDSTPRAISLSAPNLESPFAKAKRDLEKQLADRENGTDLLSSFDEYSAASSPLLNAHLATLRGAPEASGGIKLDQEDRIATPPQVTRESLDPSAMGKRRTSLAAAAAANMTRNRFGAKVVAAPIDDAAAGVTPINPFSSPEKRQPLSAVQGATNSPSTPRPPQASSAKWDGIADLRATPLGSAGSPVRLGKRKASSPPVTMQFSMPRSKWLKTPAKEAARLVVDELLRTAERHGPSADELISRRHAEYELAKQSSTTKSALFQDRPETGSAMRAPATMPAPEASAIHDDSDSDSDDDSDESDVSGVGASAGGPGATRPISAAAEGGRRDPTASSASLLSSRSLTSDVSAVQALKDDTLFGSKLGANPFFLPGSNASGSGSGSVGNTSGIPGFAPRGNVGDLGTFNFGRPLIGGEDLSSPLKDWRGKDNAPDQ